MNRLGMKAIADEIARKALAELADVCESPEAGTVASTTTARELDLDMVAMLRVYEAMTAQPPCSLPARIIESEYLTDSHTAIKRWRRRSPYRMDKVRIRTWTTPSEMIYVVKDVGLVMHPVRARELEAYQAVANCQLPTANCQPPKEAP